MAVEIERLVAVLEANMTKFDKAFAKATGTANKELSGMEKRGREFAANLNAATASGSQGLERMNRNMMAVRGQTGNLAAQFQDIAVQLQGGSSPLTIALQQGTQINQVLGPLGVRGAVGALGGAFASLLNPVSLLTIGTIALGGAAIQYFASVFDGGEKSAETIQKQADLIRQVAKEWGDAVPALQAYVDELDRAKSIGDLQSATELQMARMFDNVRPQVDEISVSVADLLLVLNDLGASSEQINSVRESFNTLRDKTLDATATADDFKAVQDAVAAVMADQGVPAAAALFDQLAALSSGFLAAAQSAAQFGDQAAAALNAAKSNYVPMDNVARGEMSRKKSFDPIETIGRYEAPKRRGGGGKSEAQRSREQAIKEAERERKAVVDLIAALEFEQSLIGLTDTEREKANQLRKAGAAATDEQKARIGALVDAMESERAAIEANAEAMKVLNDLGRDVLGGFVRDLASGKSATEALAGALDKVASKLLDIALNSVFDNLFSGSSGGGFGSILGSLFGGGGGDPWSGMRANGGPVSSGRSYLVGERGPEVFVPGRSGGIVSNKALNGGGSSNGSVYAPVYQIDARGSEAGVENKIRAMLSEYDRNVAPKTAVNAIQKSRSAGVIR